MQRIEELEIPEDAFREILYNAIVHKQYTGAPIQMRIFEDHIELWNEGNLPENYTVETLMHKHASKPRNLNIASVFYMAGFIEAWGRGYKKIQDGFNAAHLPMPVFATAFGGVEVTIQRPKQDTNDPKNDTKDDTKQLTERQSVILQLIRDNDTITIAEMIQKTNVSAITIKRDLLALQKKEILKRAGGRKDGKWVIL